MAVIDRTQLLADTKLYLPASNTLSDTLLSSIIDTVVDNQIPADDDIYYSEALCKTLYAAALLNKSKAAVDSANVKFAKAGEVEKEIFQAGNTSLWDNYLDTLPDVCPFLPGGGYSPSVGAGMVINPSKPFVIDDCPPCNTTISSIAKTCGTCNVYPCSCGCTPLTL